MNHRTTLLVLTAGLLFTQAVAALADKGLITFSEETRQTQAELRDAWFKYPEETRKKIETHLLTELGLSSTGTIRLLGVFDLHGTTDKKASKLLQFQQVDLFGSRLFWTVLIDPDALTSRVIYHVDESKIQTKAVAFRKFVKP